MPDGIFVTHATGVYYMPHKNYSAGIIKKLSKIFPHVDPYFEYIPSFGTLWSYATGSHTHSPKTMSAQLIQHRLRARGIERLLFYSPVMHERVFMMPLCLRRQLPVRA
jgi:spermidine synthase